ncbi:MAG: precorrin-6A/cobalt-precorrin-6A reductase [Sulfitobacter sp.]
MTLMILAGSAEARVLGERAMKMGAHVRALVSEPPRGAKPMPMPCTLLPFDDVDAVMAQMRGCDAVLDASHGFDAVMSRVGFEAAQRLGAPFMAYVRPLWTVPAGVDWHAAPDVPAAMPLIAPGARVFSANGWASLPDFAAFPGARLLLRQTHAHPRTPPFDFIELIFGEPPFTVESEIALFCALSADTLICRNLGGQASRPKLDAAQTLSMKVILIDRPPLPKEVEVTDDLDAALAWIAAQ